MTDWLTAQKFHFALGAAVLSSVLCIVVYFKAPGNPVTYLLTAILACVAEWNFCEWAQESGASAAMNFQFVGISFLPALLLHFAVSVVGRGRLAELALTIAYGVAIVLSCLAMGAFFSKGLAAYFDATGRIDGDYNRHWAAIQGPILALAVGLLAFGGFSGSREIRLVLPYMLAAGVIGGGLGILDLLKLGPQLANIGAAFVSAALAVAVWRHREMFDSVAILQRETSGLLARTHHGVASFDAKGNLVFANELAARLLGGRPRTLADLDASLPGLLARGGDRFFRRGEGVLRATVLPARSRMGGAPRHYLLVEDCTEQARLLGEMAQRESLVALGEASAGMAHEIRNALTALGTNIDTLSREPRPDPEALRGLNAEVRRLNETMTKCLSLARVMPLDRQDVDLHRLLRRVAETLPPGSEVALDPEGGQAVVHADPDLLGQVFYNLLKNAVEAGASSIRMAARREEGEAVVTVENRGPPLRADVLSRLFEPFVTAKPGGTGLGLSICRKIVAAHGGRISGRNVEGGVEFEVRLPWTS